MTSNLVNHQMDQIYRGRYGEHDESDEDDTRYYRYYVNKVKKEQGGEEEDLEEKEESTDTEEDIGYNNYPSTSEVEEECYKPDDTNTYDNYEDDEEGEDRCPTCNNYYYDGHPPEEEDYNGHPPEEEDYDGHLPNSGYYDSGYTREPDDEYHKYSLLFKCGALYPKAICCNFAADCEEECVSHLRDVHSTSRKLIQVYARIA